jgi:ABC-type multidrug transport system permease subunit
VVALGTGFLPRWLGWVVFVAALVAVLKFLVPHATLALLWILVVPLLMITGSVMSPSTTSTRRLERSS